MGRCTLSGEFDCQKIPLNVDVKYLWGNRFALGNVTEISKSCVCIYTRFCFPIYSKIELLFPFKRNVITILSRVSGYKHIDSLYDTMHVEVLNPSQEYLEFVSSFEKRIHKRVSVHLEAALVYDGKNCTGFMRNISEYGVNVIIRPGGNISDFNSANILDLRLTVSSGEKLNLTCRKIWTHPVLPEKLHMNAGMGIIDPPEQYNDFLKTFF
jgi:hypothetical protein